MSTVKLFKLYISIHSLVSSLPSGAGIISLSKTPLGYTFISGVSCDSTLILISTSASFWVGGLSIVLELFFAFGVPLGLSLVCHAPVSVLSIVCFVVLSPAGQFKVKAKSLIKLFALSYNSKD